jgi:hypothetical protein
MRGFRSLNSGEARYFSNSDSQSARDSGGREPVTGFHSVILSLQLSQQVDVNRRKTIKYPDSVNLVSPPNTTIPNTLAVLANNQYATEFVLVLGKKLLSVSFVAFWLIVWLRELKGLGF